MLKTQDQTRDSNEYAEDTGSDKDEDNYNDEEQPSPRMHVQALRIHQH
jgi:hypothetical protein